MNDSTYQRVRERPPKSIAIRGSSSSHTIHRVTTAVVSCSHAKHASVDDVKSPNASKIHARPLVVVAIGDHTTRRFAE